MQEIHEWVQWRKNLRFISPKRPTSTLAHPIKVDGMRREEPDFPLSPMNQALEIAYNALPNTRDKAIFEAFYLAPRNVPVKTIAAAVGVNRRNLYKAVNRFSRDMYDSAVRVLSVSLQGHKIAGHTFH